MMPLPNLSKKRKKKDSSQEVDKVYFDETFEVHDSDSDSDFKNPQPLRRIRISENTKRRLEVEEGGRGGEGVVVVDIEEEGEEVALVAGSGFGTDKSNDNGTSTDSWKDLMQRMQTNQKASKDKDKNHKTNPQLTKKGRTRKKQRVVKLKKTNQGPKLTLKSTSVNQGSPSKRLKVHVCIDEVDSVAARMNANDGEHIANAITIIASPSSSKTALDDRDGESSSEPAKTKTNSVQELKDSKVKIPNLFLKPSERLAIKQTQNDQVKKTKIKIPEMFLKPSERLALVQTRKLEKSSISQDLCEALKLLSTEPDTYASAHDAHSIHFDGDIVKLNEVEVENVPSGQTPKTKVCPFYKKIPGTKFSVDAFNYGLIDGVEVYFLSHFHSDHYQGLSKKFCKTLVCSPPTANLVKMKLGVQERCIRRLQVNKPYIVDDVEVTLLHANHCPGSVMFIFRLKNGTVYLHTGDFRYSVDMLENQFLKGLRVDCLYLDTTYADPQYNFPTQALAIVEVISEIKRRIVSQPKTLVLCGSYVIGKERVYFSIAEALNAKVFMDDNKRRIIHALENPRYIRYLADSEDQASVHVHQMFSISPKFLSDYLGARTSQYTHIIGVKPTGWQFTSSGSGASVKSYHNDTVTVIGVPYSEHSSFSELEQFVRALKPRHVQPTVNVGNSLRRERMMEHITSWMTK